MSTSKKLVISMLFSAFLGVLPLRSVSADEGRYLIKTNKNFWKNALGVRNVFDGGFTTDLSDFQVRFARVWGVEIEPVKVLQILPATPVGGPATVTPEVANAPSAPSSKSPSRPKLARALPSDQTPWGIEMVYNDPAISKTAGGGGVKVAVLDTGVLTSHPDLKERILQCKDFTNLRLPLVDGKCEDKNGHGTHVAGIIAADGGADSKGIYGVAPEARLLIYKVCDNSGTCYADDIATALRLAADQGAAIVNMSFGSDGDSGLIHGAIDYAVEKGVLPVAAAGNDGPFDASIDYPAAQAEVIAVGAIDQNKTITEWSSRGVNTTTAAFVVEEKDIEFATPGANVESTWNNAGYVIFSGTSMAAPFVSGLAAKYWQSGTPAPATATRELLHKLANDLAPNGDDNASGFGLVQVQP